MFDLQQRCIVWAAKADAGRRSGGLDVSGDRLAILSGLVDDAIAPAPELAWTRLLFLNGKRQSPQAGTSGGGLSCSPAGRNREIVSDSRQNVVHGQNESVDAIDAQEPGARLARVENCKRIAR